MTNTMTEVECQGCGAAGTFDSDVIDAVTPHDVHIEAGRARMNYAGHLDLRVVTP